MAPKISTLEIGRKYNLDNRFDPGDLKREIRAKQDRLNQLIGTLDKEKDLVNLEEEILQLQNLKQQQKVEYNKTLEQFNQQTKIELRQFENDKQKEILELKRQIEEMTDKKNYMEKYPERKTIYEQTLDQLNGEIEQEKIDFDNDQKRQIENFHKKTKEKDQQTKSKIEEQQFQAKQDAWAMIKNSQQTLNENEKLQQNLKLYQQELDELKQQRTDIFSLNENLKMEFDQYEQSTKEYQTLNFKQTQKIKKLKEKYEYLKKFMDTEVKLYPQKLKDIQQKYDEKVQQQNYEFKCLAETLRKKFQEVKHIRGLSQMILDQRTDVEIFLLQALDQIKGEIQRQRKKRFYQFKTDQNNSNINGSIKFPDINLGQDILANSQQVDNQYEEQSIELKKQLNQKIKVSDLDPEDKEKILRIVFEKMNKGQQPINWRQFNKNGNINHDSTGLEEGLGDNSTLQ